MEINNRPPGIMSLLKLRGSGDGAPSNFASTLSAILDLSDLYTQLDKLSVVTPIADAIPAAGTIWRTFVPNSEIWYVHGWSVGFTMPAAGTLKVQAAVWNPDNIVYDGGEFFTFAAGDAPFVCGPKRGFWMMPGESLGVHVTNQTGVVANVTGIFARVGRSAYHL